MAPVHVPCALFHSQHKTLLECYCTDIKSDNEQDKTDIFDSICRKQADVDAPDDPSQRTEQIPSLHRLDQRKIDKRNKWPEFRACQDQGPKFLFGLRPHKLEIHLGKVDGIGAEPVADSLGQVGDTRRVTARHA